MSNANDFVVETAKSLQSARRRAAVVLTSQKKTTSPSWRFNNAADFDAMAEFTLEDL